jgi:N-acyl homoserine lactone hydrolase
MKRLRLLHIHPTLLLSVLFLSCLACAASHHSVAPSELGRVGRSDEMIALIDRPGPIEFEAVKAADWVVARGGLINLDHPKARAAGLEDGDEPIGIYFYAIRHPRFGTFLVDSGVETDFRDPDGNARLSFLVESAMRTSTLEIHTTTAEWLDTRDRELAGVFLTHLHLDHVMGLPDVPTQTPVYIGPGEPDAAQFLNLFSRGTIDRLLAETDTLREWNYAEDSDGRFAAVVDIFGDGSAWAIHVPGHSPGSTAYLLRTQDGPKLLVGDASHTRWGWENGVEPGSFSLDGPRSVESLATLLRLVHDHPDVEVYLGHQQLADTEAAMTSRKRQRLANH